MPWTLLRKTEYSGIFDNTIQSLVYFYFLIDQPLEELEGKGYFNNSLQYAAPFASWVKTFSESWGQYLDSENSWNEEYYQRVLKDPAFGLQNDWYEDPENWKTFNQFFARYLDTPGIRPISSPENDSIVVSFADSEPQGVWDIDSNSNLVAKDGLAIKSATLKSIVNLIGEDSPYKDAFANGSFTHSFLSVNDYHRYHFPVSGTIREARIIQGINPSGGSISWDAEHHRYAFDPSSIGWQTIETRGCVILETDQYGLIALFPIGMAVIGSVNFEKNISPGTRVKKGDMLGHFAFGGSDFIMLFQEQVTFTLDAQKKAGTNHYQHLLMGERLGYLSKPQSMEIREMQK
jgi:phosphatidylserine decarboxylase precursor